MCVCACVALCCLWFSLSRFFGVTNEGDDDDPPSLSFSVFVSFLFFSVVCSATRRTLFWTARCCRCHCCRGDSLVLFSIAIAVTHHSTRSQVAAMMSATTGGSNGSFLRKASTFVLCCCAGIAAPVGAVDPAFAKNLTVFHINPLSFGPVPLNMDVGDAAGDLFFDLWDVIAYPIACPDGPQPPAPSGGGHGHNNCGNPETFGNLVVNKLTIEVDSRFSGYAKCNIGVNGTDGRGHPCEDDTYCCFCGGFESPHPEPCNATIGFENVSSFFGGQSRRVCTVRNASDPVELATCWKENSVRKFGGDE